MELVFEVAFVASAGDPCEIDCRASHASDPPIVIEAGGENAFVEFFGFSDVDWLVVEKGALSSDCGKELVANGIQYDAYLHDSALCVGNGNAVMRNAVCVVVGGVQGINNPEVLILIVAGGLAFFE